jgi:hypothetical protein
MKLFALVGVIALGLCTAVATADPPRDALINFVCQRALDPPARAVSVQAVIRPLPGTKKLSLRFQLLMRRNASSPVSSVHGGDLGTWISPPDPTLGQQPGDKWKVSRSVLNLAAPASYRFRVQFRWTGAAGRVLGTVVRFSPTCVQPELRPDLLVRSITVRSIAGRPDKDEYIALIRNAGATGAGPFQVSFVPGDSSAPKMRTVARLQPHQTVQEAFFGPLCSASSAPTITVDPAGQVDDLNRSNNALTAICPA